MFFSCVDKTVRFCLFFAVLGSAMSGCAGSHTSTTLPAVPQVDAGSASSGRAAARVVHAHTSAVTVPPGYPGVVLLDTPIAYYQLADASTTLLDSGPSGLAGVYGAAVTRGAAPITAGGTAAATFPGGPAYNAQGYAFVPRNAAFEVAKPTLEAWFVLSAGNATQHDLPVVVYGSINRGARYGLFIHGLGSGQQSLQFQLRNAGRPAFIIQSHERLALKKIYHVVVSFVGSNVALYINGALDDVYANQGSVDYSPYFTDGFQIGGGDQVPQYASASFPGTIAQVAVYAGPLTEAQVINHYAAGETITMSTETPSAADRFVDSIGINTHFENPEGLYGTQFAAVKTLLVASGIRHMRAGITYSNPAYASEMQQLAAAGVHATYVTQVNMTQAQIVQWPQIMSPSLEQYEAPNELDDVGNPNWIPGCIAFQKNLYSWVKSDPQLAHVPVIGPSIVNMTDAINLGDLSAYMDNGNMHNYFNVFNPGTYGWGNIHTPFGIYGSIPFNMNIARVIDGTKPIEATETGYGTIAGDPQALDYRTHLRYMTRLFFEQFNYGIPRTYSYEFLDQGGTAIFSNFGLLTTALQPKPAYTGIKSIISALADPGPTFSIVPLTYDITGSIDAVQHTLLEKRNGHYILAVWIEAADWVTLNNAGGDIIVPPQTITLTTANRFSSASMSTMDESGNLTSAPLAWNGHSATISITDKISLVDLAP